MKRNLCLYCRHSGKTVAYFQLGRRKSDRLPILWCQKHQCAVLCTETRPCFQAGGDF